MIREAVRVHLASPARLTLDELDNYDGLTVVLREYGFLYKQDMEQLAAMVRRHARLRSLIPYAVSADTKELALARLNITRMRAAIKSVDDEHLETRRSDFSPVEKNRTRRGA